jgi:outer membrane protein assembly factor BamB
MSGLPDIKAGQGRAGRLSRRAVLVLPAVLGGCSLFDSWFGENKAPLPGKRVAVISPRRGLEVDARDARVVLPPPAANAAWPQAGGIPSHAMGHLQVRDVLAPAWHAGIGEGGGYRSKITAQPVVAGGRVFTMDSDAVVTAYDSTDGRQVWRVDTQAEGDRSTNVGGGIAVEGDILYAGTGRAELLALAAATGSIRWRKTLATPVRAAPTIADGRIFVITLDSQIQALAADDGRRLWGYQATNPETSMLGLPAPAYADGLVVAGFGSGDLVALRAATGSVAWSDSLAAVRGRNSLLDLSAVRGLPVVTDGRVYAGGVGGLTLSLDLRTGRRLWERDIATGDTLWVAGDWLFLLSSDGHVAAVRRSDGRIAWVTELPQFEDEEKKKDPIHWIGPVLAGDRLILGSSNGLALAVSPYTGDILGRQDLSGPVAVAPAVAGGTVYVITDDATLAALR